MNLTGLKIGSKYMVGPKIGSGSFGQVYVVNQIGTYSIFALKKEDEKTKHSQLPLQAKILKQLNGYPGFSQIYWQGIQAKSNIVVMDMLGPSLEDLFEVCEKKFTLKCTAMIADQMIERIEDLHKKNYIHRDIKPENFLMGINEKSHVVHIIDFGLSKKYRDQKTLQHIPYKQNKSLTGTARYASVNTHLGIQQSRRDDLEAIGYVLLYFVQGYLPWQGIKANSKAEKYQKIMQKKMTIPIQIQCEGLPIEFSIYLNYTRSLKFEDQPDYSFLRKLFRDLLEHEEYDWCNIDENKHYNNGKINIDLQGIKSEDRISSEMDKVIEKGSNEDISDDIIDGQENIQQDQEVDQLNSEDGINLKEEDQQLDMQYKRSKMHDYL